MRSITYLQPGETTSCIGCHEPRTSAPGQRSRCQALRRAPSTIRPAPDGAKPLSYPILVQPVLDRQCVACHNRQTPEGKVVLTGEPEGHYTASYNALATRVPYSDWAGKAGDFRVVNCEPTTQPGFFGARGSSVMQLILKGHHDVSLTPDELERIVTWMDANALFYGTFDPADQAASIAGSGSRGRRSSEGRLDDRIAGQSSHGSSSGRGRRVVCRGIPRGDGEGIRAGHRCTCTSRMAGSAASASCPRGGRGSRRRGGRTGATGSAEVALATQVHANCIRLWIEFSAWMADPDAITARFLDAVAAIDAAGMKTMPCLFNRWHDDRFDYGGTYTETLMRNWAPSSTTCGPWSRPLASDRACSSGTCATSRRHSTWRARSTARSSPG